MQVASPAYLVFAVLAFRSFATGEGEVAARVTRLLKPVQPLPTAAVLAICLSAAVLVAAPVTLLLV